MPNGKNPHGGILYHAAKRSGIGTRNWNRLLRGDNTISGSIKFGGLPYVVPCFCNTGLQTVSNRNVIECILSVSGGGIE